MLTKTPGQPGNTTRRLIFRNDYALAVELNFAASPPSPKLGVSQEFKIPPVKLSTKLLSAKSVFCRGLDGKQGKKPDQKQQ